MVKSDAGSRALRTERSCLLAIRRSTYARWRSVSAAWRIGDRSVNVPQALLRFVITGVPQIVPPYPPVRVFSPLLMKAKTVRHAACVGARNAGRPYQTRDFEPMAKSPSGCYRLAVVVGTTPDCGEERRSGANVRWIQDPGRLRPTAERADIYVVRRFALWATAPDNARRSKVPDTAPMVVITAKVKILHIRDGERVRVGDKEIEPPILPREAQNRQ